MRILFLGFNSCDYIRILLLPDMFNLELLVVDLMFLSSSLFIRQKFVQFCFHCKPWKLTAHAASQAPSTSSGCHSYILGCSNLEEKQNRRVINIVKNSVQSDQIWLLTYEHNMLFLNFTGAKMPLKQLTSDSVILLLMFMVKFQRRLVEI